VATFSLSAAQRYSAEFGVAALIAFVSWFTISPGIPQIYAPFNFLILVPYMWTYMALGDASIVFVILIVPAAFCVWSLSALHGGTTIPNRSLILMIVAVALSAIWWVIGFDVGIKYNGATYVAGITTINLACYAVMGVLAIAGRLHPTYARNLMFHGVLFGWLAWMAFPYLGEI
jgi:hypothetical protein